MKKFFSCLIALVFLFSVFTFFNNMGINNVYADTNLVYAGADIPENLTNGVQSSTQIDTLSSNVLFQNNYLTQYFYKLTNNFGRNIKGTCGYVALGMLLSYYDTFWNDSFIHSIYENNSSLTINRITEQDESPGIKRDDYIVNTQMSNTAYVKAMQQYSNEYFHLKLIQMGMEQFNLFNVNSENPGFLEFDDLVRLTNYYLYDYKQFSATQISVVTCNNLITTPSFVVDKIKQGIPVLLLISNIKNGHYVIAYDYDENNDTVYAHYGWGASDTHVKISSSDYTIYCGAISFDVDLAHSCSNNYVYSTGGTETKHCPCELAIHPSHVHSYSGHNCVTCNTYTPAHDYTFNYVQKDGAQHTAYCVCGASKAEDHTYSESYLWLDGYSHRAYCECGAATKRGHAVASGAKPPYTCIFCNGSAQAGITEYSLSIPIGATQITENGSYVLPNGITIVAEADLEDFLNGTPKLLKHNLVLSA